MDPRDQTFITIHNLTPEANILFASDSILDILGYQPDEVRGKSCFEFFHPDEVKNARHIHGRGVLLDKAAVLHYARIRARDGTWQSCECCFTIVHDVLVASTSIYCRGEKSQRRALEGAHVRRIFSSSPLDPRYHMLEHLSPKFRMPPTVREPRAALILNRFTRQLTIMYATSAVAQVLGLTPDDVKDRPFYDYIEPRCIEEAEKCLESAKANESIAYLRFWFKDPRIDESDGDETSDEEDDEADEVGSSDLDIKDESEGGEMDIDEEPESDTPAGRSAVALREGSRTPPMTRSQIRKLQRRAARTFELEAVVSCTSDGLVVVLRRARPPIPNPQPPILPAAFNYENGLFAAPWGNQPIEPYISPDLLYNFRPPLLPQYMPLRDSVKAAGGPPIDQLMRSIRDVAVFAWALAGINGNMAAYGHGMPRTGAQPADGLPVWDPSAGPTDYRGPQNRTVQRSRSQEPDDPRAESASRREAMYHAAESVHHGFARARHSSLDEAMYDGAQSAWPQRTPPRYSGHETAQPSHSTFSHDARRDPSGHQRIGFPSPQLMPQVPSRCNVPREAWSEASSSRSCIPSYGPSSSRRNNSGDAPSGKRHYWE